MTDRLRAAAQAALEALVIAEAGLADIGDADREPGDDLAWCEQRASEALDAPRKAIEQLRAALAEPEVEQEPVGWQYVWSPGMCFTTDSMATLHNYVQGAEDRLPPEKRGYVRALYTTPPRREWVPLTEEEKLQFVRQWHNRRIETIMDLVGEIEAALKEKNHD